MDAETREIIKLQGIVTDIPPMELMGVPVWTGGSNVHFDDTATHRCGGYGPFADPLPSSPDLQLPIFLQEVLTPETAYWIYVAQDKTTPANKKIWVTDGTNHFDITPVAGVNALAEAGTWTGTLLNNLPVLNNEFDIPVYWDGNTGNVCQPLPDWDATWRCKSIRAFKYHLIAINMTINSVQQPEMVKWSASADPGSVPASWTPEPGNDAGDTILATELGGLVDGGPLKDFFMLYRQHSTAIMTYIAGQFVFAFRELFPTQGIQHLNCWVEMRGRHFVFADDDIIEHDGNQARSIIDQKNRNVVFGSLNPDNQKLAQMVGRTETDEIWIVIPRTDTQWQDVALVYSFVEEVWGLRSLPGTAFIAAGIIPYEVPDTTWDGSPYGEWENDPRYWNEANYSISNDQLLMANPTDGKLHHVDELNTNDGDPVVARVERLFHNIGGEGDVWENNLVRSIYPRFTGTEGDTIEVQVAATRSSNAPINWNAPITLTIGDTNPKVDSFCHGRYFHMRFSSTGGDPWQLHRIGLEYIPLAKY